MHVVVLTRALTTDDAGVRTCSGIEHEDGKTDADRQYALFLADTVLVTKTEPEVMTPTKKLYDDICFEFKGEDDDDDAAEEDAETEAKQKEMLARLENNPRRRGGGSGAAPGETAAGKDEKMRLNQEQLSKDVDEQAKRRLLKTNADIMNRAKTKDTPHCFKRFDQMDSDQNRSLKIYVDKARGAVIFPVYGMPVPFHIASIKQVVMGDEDEDRSINLRVTFDVPGVTLKPEYQVRGENLVYVKELTYRTKNIPELQNIVRKIKDLQKKHREALSEEKQQENFVEQEDLIHAKPGDPKIVLKDLYVKPSIGARGKRIQGTLQAHRNGFLFTTRKGEKLKILYSRIKHALFQPPDDEVVIMLHFHLRHGITMNKKQVIDIQFYTEVDDVSTDLSKSKGIHDRDEIEAEQRQRRMQKKLRDAFKSFYNKVQNWTSKLHEDNRKIPVLEFDSPVRELGFMGVPLKSTVLCQPTTHCLVNLTDQNPFVLSLDDVERVVMERVDFSLRNFDIVFIMKDYEKAVVHVNAVPMKAIAAIKDWLDSCDIKFTERGGPNLEWKKIMKTILDDPEEFFETGGWNFLEPEVAGSDEEEEEESDGFASPDEEEFAESEDSEEYESDSDASDDESGSDDDSGSDDLGSDEEAGMDWDEMEEQAKKQDARKPSAYDAPEPQKSKRKRDSTGRKPIKKRK